VTVLTQSLLHTLDVSGCQRVSDGMFQQLPSSHRYVLQCVAVCCSVVRVAAGCQRVSDGIFPQQLSLHWYVLQCVAVCCSVVGVAAGCQRVSDHVFQQT